MLARMGTARPVHRRTTTSRTSSLGQGRWQEALDELEIASELDPRYLQRAYWHAEAGACLFELGRYAQAAQRYQRSLRLGHPGTLVRLADTVAHLGRYREATELLDRAARDDGTLTAYWALKRLVLGVIAERIGVEQARPGGVPRDDHEEVLESAERRAAGLERLVDDGLDHGAWFMVATAEDVLEHPGALDAAIAAVTTGPHCPRASSFAATLARENGDAALQHVILSEGYRRLGDAMFDDLAEFLNADDDFRLTLDRLAAALRDGVASETREVTLRFLTEKVGSVNSFWAWANQRSDDVELLASRMGAFARSAGSTRQPPPRSPGWGSPIRGLPSGWDAADVGWAATRDQEAFPAFVAHVCRSTAA